MTNGAPKKMKETERITGQIGPGRGPHSMGMVGQKSQNFGDSGKRLLDQLRPERLKITAIFIAAIVGVGLAAIGPRVLGRATDIVFAGAIGKELPGGVTREQVIEQARARGDEQIADLLTGVDMVPGQGIDFEALAGVLLLVLVLYAASSLLSFLQGYLLTGVVQNTLRRMRNDVEDKLNRMPLSYFDRQPRGELLSRVTNDLDNVSQTLQQTMSQLLTALLTS